MGNYFSEEEYKKGNNGENKYKEMSIQTLIRQAARWAIASHQDESPIIAVLHANYAAGYLWAVKDIATDYEIERITNIKLNRLENYILDTQDLATKKLTQSCPQYLGKIDPYIAKIAGNA